MSDQPTHNKEKPDLNGLESLWHSGVDQTQDMPAVSRIISKAQKKLLRMKFFFALEILMIIAAMVSLTVFLKFDTLVFTIFFVFGQSVFIGSLWYAVANRKGIWSPSDNSAKAMLLLEKKRAQRSISYIYYNIWMFIPGIIMVILAIYGSRELFGDLQHERVQLLIKFYGIFFIACIPIVIYALRLVTKKKQEITDIDALIDELQKFD